MSFKITYNLDESKKLLTSSRKEKLAYETLIANIKYHNSSEYNIATPLREPMAEVIEPLDILYGEFVEIKNKRIWHIALCVFY